MQNGVGEVAEVSYCYYSRDSREIVRKFPCMEVEKFTNHDQAFWDVCGRCALQRVNNWFLSPINHHAFSRQVWHDKTGGHDMKKQLLTSIKPTHYQTVWRWIQGHWDVLGNKHQASMLPQTLTSSPAMAQSLIMSAMVHGACMEALGSALSDLKIGACTVMLKCWAEPIHQAWQRTAFIYCQKPLRLSFADLSFQLCMYIWPIVDFSFQLCMYIWPNIL